MGDELDDDGNFTCARCDTELPVEQHAGDDLCPDCHPDENPDADPLW